MSSASIYESLGSQFLQTTVITDFRTTIGIKLGLNAFDELKVHYEFLTILGVTEILCSFRLVLEGKTGNELSESSRLEFLETFLANNFALSVTEAKFLESGGLFNFINICKFGSFKNPFELYFRFRRFILLVQTKN